MSLVSSVSSQTAAMFPAFGLGALALQMGDDLGFTEAGLGSAVAFFFLLAAVTSPHAGTHTDRLGPQRSLRVANICSGAALLGVALVVQSYWLLLAALGVGAIGLTIAGPGTKTMVARGTDVPPPRPVLRHPGRGRAPGGVPGRCGRARHRQHAGMALGLRASR